MKKKFYTVLGLMSGTSMDGIDVSIINSDGNSEYTTILDKYFEYNNDLYEQLVNLRSKVTSKKNLKTYAKELKSTEREITLFNANIVSKILNESKIDIDFIGFHGQTIFHDTENKITKQLGDGMLLSSLTKEIVIYNFRQNDLNNGGQGAPLTPIFHNLIANKINKKYKIGFPISILNIGGISNITNTVSEKKLSYNQICAHDIGPGNCLIDDWIRKNSKKKYDKNGLIAKSGNTNKLILNQAMENFNIESYNKSLDINDFDISFAKGLSLEDGASTITDYTSSLIAKGIKYTNSINSLLTIKCLVCGGGRKNQYLIDGIKKNKTYLKKISLEPIEKYGIDGDFVESQAFGFLAIRTFLDLPISFPKTTRCKKPSTGGVIVKNF
ncbi:anhydro-N-acetylmuramic acid kinase [Candidatus Pelagibacter sp.]|nr:anhydro-N-acetylmuramic acid kinase [Candidatus Pelagibacter sp.]